MGAREIVVVAYDDVELLDVACPGGAFGMADRAGATPGYRVRLAALATGSLRSSCGIWITPEIALGDLHGRLDTLVVAGGRGSLAAAADPAVLDQVRRLAPLCRRVASVCTGARVLAAAGLLDGRRATTHWRRAAELARQYPRVMVDPAPLYVRDGNVYTSAGVTSALDLTLALIEEDHGAELARRCAQGLVTYLQRPGNQAQLSMFVAPPAPQDATVQKAMDYVLERLDQDLSTPALARYVGVSSRHLCRLFAVGVGSTPSQYVRMARLEAAKHLLTSTDEPVATVARRSGFGSTETLRQALVRHTGLAPATYRQRLQGTNLT